MTLEERLPFPVFCDACRRCGVWHCAHPEDCKTPEELAAWETKRAAWKAQQETTT